MASDRGRINAYDFQADYTDKLKADLADAVRIIRAQSEHVPDWHFDPEIPANEGKDRADWLAWRLNADAATIRRLLGDNDRLMDWSAAHNGS